MELESQTVCVTGASGFIGSWLVMRLLEKGYTVRATVRDPDNIKKVKHLIELPKAESHLTLWKADLSEEGSFDATIQGCSGVFHVATPMDFESTDPENEVIKPTINGVLDIIKACVKTKTVRKLVFTSSAGTVCAEEHKKPVYDESNWSDLEFVYAKKMTGWGMKLITRSLGSASLSTWMICAWLTYSCSKILKQKADTFAPPMLLPLLNLPNCLKKNTQSTLFLLSSKMPMKTCPTWSSVPISCWTWGSSLNTVWRTCLQELSRPAEQRD